MPDDNDISSSASFAVGFSDLMRRLSDADYATVVKALTDPTQRYLPIDLRDQAIRDLDALFSGSPSGRAKAMADELRAYVGGAWLRERESRPPTGASQRRQLMFRIVQAGGGLGLSWRRILDILGKKKSESLQPTP